MPASCCNRYLEMMGPDCGIVKEIIMPYSIIMKILKKNIHEQEGLAQDLAIKIDHIASEAGELLYTHGLLIQFSQDLVRDLDNLHSDKKNYDEVRAKTEVYELRLKAINTEIISLNDRQQKILQEKNEKLKELAFFLSEHAASFHLPSLDRDIQILQLLIKEIADLEAELDATYEHTGKPGLFLFLGRAISRASRKTYIKTVLPGIKGKMEVQALSLGGAASRLEVESWENFPVALDILTVLSNITINIDANREAEAALEKERADIYVFLEKHCQAKSIAAAIKYLDKMQEKAKLGLENLYLEAGKLYFSNEKGLELLESSTIPTSIAQKLQELYGEAASNTVKIDNAHIKIWNYEKEIQLKNLEQQKTNVQTQIQELEQRILLSKTHIEEFKIKISAIEKEMAQLKEQVKTVEQETV